jgi:hypothetical protein
MCPDVGSSATLRHERLQQRAATPLLDRREIDERNR